MRIFSLFFDKLEQLSLHTVGCGDWAIRAGGFERPKGPKKKHDQFDVVITGCLENEYKHGKTKT